MGDPSVDATAHGEGVARVPGDAAASPTPVQTPAEALQRLRELFPALFVGTPKPLKLRIQSDIQARAPGQLPKPLLSGALRRYTGSTGYLFAVAKGTQRFDLDGQPAGELSAEHRQVAQTEIDRRRAAQNEKRAVEEQGRRDRAQLLRDYERTTLTRANFLALRGLSEAELDATLALAREEAAQRPPPSGPRGRDDRAPGRGDRQARGHPRGDGRRGGGPGPRHDGGARGDRRDGAGRPGSPPGRGPGPSAGRREGGPRHGPGRPRDGGPPSPPADNPASGPAAPAPDSPAPPSAPSGDKPAED